MDIKNLAISARQTIAKNSPTILTIFGVAGLVGTAINASRATIRAMKIVDVEAHNAYHGVSLDIPEANQVLTKMEIVQLCWKEYIPTVIMGGLSISCIIGANSVNLKRQAALASLYSVATSNLKEYQEKVVEVVGKNKAEKIQDEYNKDVLAKNPQSNIIRTGHGDTLFFEPMSARYFYHDLEKVKRVENEMNKQMLREPFVSVNDYYYLLGLEYTSQGNELGWDIDDDLINLRYGATLTPDQQPCIILDWDVAPSWL